MFAFSLFRSVWLENLKRMDYTRDVSVDGRIILKCIQVKYEVRILTGFHRPGADSSGGLL